MPKPGIDELLVQTVLQPELRRRLLEFPEEAFLDFDLTEEHKEILLHPDQRLLRLLGEALVRHSGPRAVPPLAPPRPAVAQAHALPDMAVVLTVVPCAQLENGVFQRFAYAVWVNPLPDGADPASFPPPPGAKLPGEPLPALHAVIQLSALQFADASGHAQVGLWASLLQSSNVATSPPESIHPASEEIRAAAEAVRAAASETRYGKLLDLIMAVRGDAS